MFFNTCRKKGSEKGTRLAREVTGEAINGWSEPHSDVYSYNLALTALFV